MYPFQSLTFYLTRISSLSPLVKYIIVLITFLISPVLTAFAQHDPSKEAAKRDSVSLPSITAAFRDIPVSIDGLLDEPIWKQAIPATQFVTREPAEGAQPQEPMEVRVLYDESAIYVGAIMHDSKPDQIGDQLVRRDERGQFDYFTFFVDSNNDRRTGYEFRVSAAGVQRDAYLFDDVDDDDAWNAIWFSAVQRHNSGWNVEIRIPLSQMSYIASEEPQSWGVNFRRRRLSSNEIIDFALESRIRFGKVSVFGRLNGLVLPKATRRIELRPYALTSARTAPSTPGNPFFDGSELEPRAGLDLKYGLGSSHILDITINPDFGQVEVDPAVVNLSAFEVFFQERRPFFIENSQVFDFSLSGGRNRLFYSRRIGRQPRGDAPDESDFEDIPNQTSILGAAKLTGRSASGLSIGALAAVTGRETGQAFTTNSNTTQEFTVEPRTEYGVLSAQQDFRNGATQLGGIATIMHRELPGNGNFDFLTSNALNAGLKFEHNWGGNRSRDWVLWGFYAGSYARGSNEAMIRIQRASNHFFQRPDATRFAVDSTATSISGYNWRLQFARQSAQNWTGSIWFAEVSPGFEINDAGFSTSGDRFDGGMQLQYREIRPNRLFRNYRFRAFTFYNFRHEILDDVFSLDAWQRSYKNGTFSGSADFELLNFWDIGIDTRYSPTRTSDTATRGGPLMKSPSEVSFGVDLSTDRRRKIHFRPSLDYDNDSGGGHELEMEMRMTYRPSPSWEFEFEPGFSTERTAAQYVTQTDDVPFAPTFGRRYIFSDLQRRAFTFETRLNLTFTRNLTLQLFAQPLLSSGDFLTYKQLARSESFDFDVFEEGTQTFVDPTDGDRKIDFDGDGAPDFSFSDRDFNFRSLRLNTVLRWEYRPGSTVFFVWQQSRSDEIDDGRFRFGRDLRGLFGAESENIFIVKFNYWFGV